tara:strand:- start:375 stop:1133 length:759 start_codon:yes stop_codon:yes gene_type:complete
MRLLPVAVLSVAACALAACASGPGPRYNSSQIDRALSNATYAAQPSLVVAREIAFARAAREDGQWTAFAKFAADDAVLHGRNGPVPAKSALAGLSDPAESVQWSPRTVMMSCDGKVAVSRGRYLYPQGNVGSYVTVWTRNGYEDDYHWIYDAGGDDVPQPTPVEPAENEIVATAYDYVQGLVADCPRGGESAPPPPALPDAGDARREVHLSSDGTLRWMWEHHADGSKYFRADYLTSGAWEKIVEERFAPSE